MALLKRVFGISVTSTPADEGCFTLGEGIVEIDLARAPELRVEGSALRLESTDLTDRLLILHGIDGTFRAYTNVCACAGWRIDPVPGEQKVRCCTLAQSTYDYDGKKLSGSAKGDLTTHAVEVDGDTLVVTLEST
jgi:cytochrome b6-f complex iron-sulfur subunit